MLIRFCLHTALLALILLPQFSHAEIKEYVRDYNYQGEVYDTAASSRINAIDGVKRELLDELGTYVGSVAKQHQDSLGNSYMSQDVIKITAGIVAMKVLNEKWKQSVYYVKAGMKADPDDVLTKLKAMRSDLELEKTLRNSFDELQRARAELEQLKAQLAQLKNPGGAVTVATTVAAALPTMPEPESVIKNMQKIEDRTQKELAHDASEPTKAPAPVIAVPAVGVATSPEVVVTKPAPVQLGAEQAQKELARDVAKEKSVSPAPAPVVAMAVPVVKPVPVVIPVAAPAAPAPSPEEKKLVASYQKAVQNVEVEETYQRAMAARMKGDFNTLVQEMSVLADRGYSKAQLRMGWINERGLGVPQDYKKAQEWYEKAAANGDVDAQAHIGNLYEHGWGVEKDYDKAADYYKRAIAAGSKLAIIRMGYLYETGKGIELNKYKAAEYYQLAIDKGNLHGQARLGLLYQQGEGVIRDARKAAVLFEQAIDRGDPLAMTRLSMLHIHGAGGVSKDYDKAVALLREAIRYNLPATYAYMGYVYLNGYGVKQDYAEAKKFLEKGAEMDAPFAEFLLGKMYIDGRGVEQDKRKAQYWFQRAKSKGFDITSHKF